MLVPAHLSYPSLVFIGAAKLLSVEYSFSDLLILMAASTVPDLDYFFCILKSKLSKTGQGAACSFEHHKLLTHVPLAYSFAPLALFFRPGLKISLICLGLFAHFILDSFFTGDGIRWFYPFSKKFFLFCGKETKGCHGRYGLDWLRAYKKTVGYKLEFISIAFLLIILGFKYL